MNIQSQNLQIEQWLKSGRTLTALDALYNFGCLRLSGRIYDLRHKGMKIKSELIEVTSPLGFQREKKSNEIQFTEMKISPLKIIEVVSDYYGVSIDDMCSEVRYKEIIKPVHIAMYFCRNLNECGQMTLQSIATLFNRDNHSSVIHACKSVQNQRETNRIYADEIKDLEYNIRLQHENIYMENDCLI